MFRVDERHCYDQKEHDMIAAHHNVSLFITKLFCGLGQVALPLACIDGACKHVVQ